MSEEVKNDEFEQGAVTEASETVLIDSSNEKESSCCADDGVNAIESEALESIDTQSEALGLVPVLQALFLSSNDPLDLETLCRVCEVEAEYVSEALKILTADLERDSYGISLVAVAKGFQLRTKPQYGKFVRALRQESPRKLSPAALETLAVIAYRQPVVKHDIDGLRGVDVMPTLKTLLERNLIKIVGHRETVGHPSLYGTTNEFLRIFGLNSLEDLPTVNEIKHMKTEPGESSSSHFENPLASLVENDPEHVSAPA